MTKLYAQLDMTNNYVAQYPLTIYQIRLLCPHISWADEPTVEILQENHFVEVVSTEPPEPISRQYMVVEVQPTLINQVWTQTWSQESIGGTLDAIKNIQLATLAEARYLSEISGTTWNTYPVATDRESQTKMSTAYMLAINNHWVDGSVWKFDDGVARAMTSLQIQDLALTVANYVGQLFNDEATIADQIRNATTIEDACNWTWPLV